MSKKFLIIMSFFIGNIIFNYNNVYALDNGWYIDNGVIYYYENNEIYKGIKEINGKYYHFGENSGQLKIGDSKTLDGRVYYSDKYGVIQTEWYFNNNHKYYSTIETGAYKGIKEIDGKYYHFGENSAQLKIGDSKTLDGRIYFSDKEGIIQTEWYSNNNHKYYSTIETGAYKGIKEIDGKWYHFGENSSQLKIGNSKTLDGRIYYSDKDGAIQTEWYSNNNHKYYSTIETGAYKGIKEIDGKWYHFGENSAQLKIGDSKTLDGRIYYSDKDGVIQTEWYSNNNHKYYSTIDTGAYKGIKEIDGKYYHFGENSGQLKYDWSMTLNKKYYYSDKDGILQKGNLLIDENWYSFNDDYSLKTGWQEINGDLCYIESNYIYYLEKEEQGYVVLYNKINGKLVTGIYRDSNNNLWYLTKDGKRVSGWVLYNENVYYVDSNFNVIIGEKNIDNELCIFDENGVYQKKQFVPIYYMQTDSRWAKKKYGSRTLKATGCAPTSMAMAFSSIKNYSIMPTDVADYLYYYTNEYNRYTIGSSGLAIVAATDYFKVKRTPINDINQIKIALLRGKIVFAAMGEGKFGTKAWNHAIVLYNYQNGKAFALDPLRDSNNGWVSIEQLIREQSKDPDDSRGGSNFYMLG